MTTKRCPSACQVCVYATADSYLIPFLLPTLQTVQRHPRNCTTTTISFGGCPILRISFSIRSSFILFAFTAYNPLAWARSLERCGLLYVFVGLQRNQLYTPPGAARFFPTIEMPFFFYTQHNSSFLEFPADFTFSTRRSKSNPYLGSHFHHLMMTQLNTTSVLQADQASMDYKRRARKTYT